MTQSRIIRTMFAVLFAGACADATAPAVANTIWTAENTPTERTPLVLLDNAIARVTLHKAVSFTDNGIAYSEARMVQVNKATGDTIISSPREVAQYTIEGDVVRISHTRVCLGIHLPGARGGTDRERRSPAAEPIRELRGVALSPGNGDGVLRSRSSLAAVAIPCTLAGLFTARCT